MDDYFILVYKGEDNTPNIRLLDENGLGEELPANKTEFFKTREVYLNHGTACFYVYHPIGITKDKLNFQNLLLASILSTTSQIPAWKLFVDMDKDRAVDLYSNQRCSVINEAIMELQDSIVH